MTGSRIWCRFLNKYPTAAVKQERYKEVRSSWAEFRPVHQELLGRNAGVRRAGLILELTDPGLRLNE